MTQRMLHLLAIVGLVGATGVVFLGQGLGLDRLYAAPLRPNNVLPTLSNVVINPTSLNEGDTATLSGTIVDPDLGDDFTLVVDWGDGSGSESFNFPAGTNGFTETHRFQDDKPSGTPSDTETVRLTICNGTNNGNGNSNGNRNNDNNAPPRETSQAGPAQSQIVERKKKKNKNNNDNGNSSNNNSDNNGNSSGNGNGGGLSGCTTTTTTLLVKNLPPTLTNVAVASSAPAGQRVDLSGTINDPGTLDTFTVLVDWGDGTAPSQARIKNRNFTDSHVYQSAGQRQITITATDDDTGIGTATAIIIVT